MELAVGSLFSGVAGIELGLERAGFEIAFFAETDPLCRDVLARHWPDVPNLGDVTAVDWSDVGAVDILAGGFPCLDLSHAHTNGTRRGLEGPHSGLWGEFARAVKTLRPRWVLVENVETWRSWVPPVRAELAGYGYASLPVVLSAGSFGAPHRRPRCFVVAHADSDGESLVALHEEVGQLRPLPRRSGHWRHPPPRALGLDDGLPRRMDRLTAYGNAVCPPVAEWLGRRLMEVAGG